MKWHVRFDQHLNQFGFALSTAFLDSAELQGFTLTCDACESDAPQVVLELMLICWTVTLTAHREEQRCKSESQ